jgi:hypothetical protein
MTVVGARLTLALDDGSHDGQHFDSRNDSHGGEPRRLHCSKGRARRLARNLGRIRGRRHPSPGFVEAFLKTIDCYVMGSRTYETALSFEASDSGGRTATNPRSFTSRDLPRTRYRRSIRAILCSS